MRFPVTILPYDGDLPPRLLALALRLEPGGAQAPAHILGPITALRELRTAADAVVTGHGVANAEDRMSLRNDVREALDQLGPRVLETIQALLSRIRSEYGRLPLLLESPEGAAITQGLVDAALDRLRDRGVRLGAWADVRAAFEDDMDAGACELRIRQLAELVELPGGDWRSTGATVRGLLRDDRFALAQVGAIPPPSPEEVNQPAGLPLERRLELARDAVAADAPEGELVVWACFANASLADDYFKLEGVEFFSHHLWPDAIRSGWPKTDEPRQEFADDWHRFLFDHLPEMPFVLVSVPLGRGLIAGAAERGRRIAHDLVRAARPYSEWRLVPGAAVHVRGTDYGWFGTSIDDRDYGPRHRFSPEYEPTAAELKGVNRDLARAVIAGREPAHAAVRDADWERAVARLPEPAQRLALGLRPIERCLPTPAGDRWPMAVTRYLKSWWVDLQLRDFIGDAAHGAVEALEDPIPIIGRRTQWRQRLLPDSGDGSYTINLRETLAALDQLRNELPVGSMQQRVVAELAASSASPENWLDLVQNFDRAFDTLLARAARQRNAVVHGADTVPEVLMSVLAFLGSLQSMVIHEQLAAAGAGETLPARLERVSLRIAERREKLVGGVPVIDAIFKAD